jgi:hypothetical protein
MNEPVARRDPFGLDPVLDRRDYARRLAVLIGQGREERGVPVLSESEAYAVAELLGQYAQVEPTAELNQLAGTLASRLYCRLGV